MLNQLFNELTPTYYKSYYESKLVGKLTLVSDGVHLIGLWYENQKPLVDNKECNLIEKDLPVFELTSKWLDIDEVPIKLIGTEFRKKVWNILTKIPYGQIMTYGDISKIVYGKPQNNSKIIGGTVSNNPISIIVPCHRVNGTKDKLTGYGGGLINKMRLLKLEKANISKLH